ncbi:MAG: hypothetical protein CMF42_04195 [Legionellales bacterium]|nr:hypothetical protein [Legionellales bacterium]OUX67545.1 MAG: hypothetical protein CBD38_02575 [bacterium TMED178]|tara:strand:- start:2721 stop:3374 length:654 start_codon:yes stop_codon:yes gene_type:complete
MQAEHDAEIVVNRLKHIYKNYKIHMLVAIAVIILSVFISYTWDHFLESQYKNGARLYWALMKEDDASKKIKLAEQFIKERPRDPYAPWVGLILMSDSFSKGNWQAVDQYAKFVVQSSNPEALQDAGSLLLARKAALMDDSRAVLSILTKMHDQAHPMKLFLEGNALKDQNQPEKAKAAYEQSIQAFSQNPQSEPMVKLLLFQISQLEKTHPVPNKPS